MYRNTHLAEEYLDHLKSAAKRRLDGMRIVVDCANGAASALAPRLFAELGAEVYPIHCEPNGININADCGSQHPQSMQAEVRVHKANLGLSFDGDADRVIIADENGNIVDGDHVMAICGLDYARSGDLPGNVVVGTVMSNIGLEIALAKGNAKLVRAPVGDRYVSEEMRRLGAIVGGEKSGHLIFSRHSTTGDGMITAIQTIDVMLQSGKPLSELASVMQEFPQLLVNVPIRDTNGWDQDPQISAAISAAEDKLKGRGRVLVRPSGTEKLIRVMAEGPDQSELEEIVGEIADVVRERLG
jgi:phosphoglucosamine mutase